MPICDVCGEEAEKVYKCNNCEVEFCEFCGSVEKRLCEDCATEEEAPGEDVFYDPAI